MVRAATPSPHRCKDDRHHFRIIVSPEDAADLSDLREYTRDLVRQMEADLGTRLDWVAVDHWNTDNPHVHLLVCGVTDQGADLVMARDYISHDLRSRGEELASAELGPKPEHEIQRALDREVTAERWTRLDLEIGRAADELGVIDLRPERPRPDDPRLRRPMIGRLQQLETMGLVAEGAQAKLRELGARGDVLLADRAYDGDAMRATLAARGAWASVKPMPNRKNIPAFSPFLYRYRNIVELFFNNLKHVRAVATRYDKRDDNFLASVQLASIRIWLRHNESVT